MPTMKPSACKTRYETANVWKPGSGNRPGSLGSNSLPHHKITGSSSRVFSCKWRGGKSGNRNRKLETRNWKPGEETSGYGGGVKSIKTRRLAKGSPPTRSGCAGSSATLSIPQNHVEHKWRAETADRDGPPKGVFMDRGSVTCRISGEFIKESCGRRTAAHQGMRSTDPRPRGIGGP